MGNKKANPMVNGMVAKTIATMMKTSGKTFNEAFESAVKTSAMKKYEFKSKDKQKIAEYTKRRLGKGKIKVIKKPAKTMNMKKKEPTKKQTKGKRIALADLDKKVHKAPKSLRMHGRVDIIQNESGVRFKKADKKAKLAILCDEESHGEAHEDGSISCVFDQN